ncbi:MAG: asparagine synthase (glutamine-hydrolyzing) [Deltaproteobacteria bacterium]|nr:asparagine synthase (glutamine-hydrolyzing) [Deltaproteobacteria bacterium]
MCGIVGLYSDASSTYRAKLEHACELIAHRGPDATNVYVDQKVGLGHRRLSIIDLSTAANQPMADPSGQVILVYNGELYNYRALRDGLGERGHQFRTTSDTEVLLAMYLEYGEAFLTALQGMFAFAIWDKRNQTLLLARDRLGIKPLYYSVTGGTLRFASEVKALLALDESAPTVDRQALHDYLTFRYTISPRTMFAGIEKLAPACALHFSARGPRLSRYWSPDYRKSEQLGDEEWIHTVRQGFSQAVTSHLVSDVPVGVLLSGGLDSSIVAAVMQAQLPHPIKTFSVGFEEGGAYDERPFARKVSQHLGTDHYEIGLTARDFVEALPSYVWHMDEPVADPASIPLYYVARLARQHVKVVLSGEGADEIFAGYAFWTQFKGQRRLELFQKIPAFLRETIMRGLNKHLLRSERVNKYLDLSRSPLSRYGSLVPFFQDDVFTEAEKQRLYRTDPRCQEAVQDSVEQVRGAYRDAEDFEFLDQMLFVSMTQWLPDDLLIKADKMTMAHSIELRVPFLDHLFVESIMRLPTHLKVRKEGNRYVVKDALKRAFADMVPPEIIKREKLGFAVPYARWFKTEMRDLLSDVLLSQTARESGAFNTMEVERVIHQALTVRQENATDIWSPQAKKVWSLFVFELWRQRFHVSCV